MASSLTAREMTGLGAKVAVSVSSVVTVSSTVNVSSTVKASGADAQFTR